jgi:hypothetical protein
MGFREVVARQETGRLLVVLRQTWMSLQELSRQESPDHTTYVGRMADIAPSGLPENDHGVDHCDTDQSVT